MNRKISNSTTEDMFNVAFKIPYGDGIFATFIYRPIVYIILKILDKLNIKPSPNKITYLAMISYIFAGFAIILQFADTIKIAELSFCESFVYQISHFLLKPLVGKLTIGILLFLIFYNLGLVLDCLDGAVARYYGKSTEAGRVLDSFSDEIGHIFSLIGLILLFREYVIPIVLIYFFYYNLSGLQLSYKYEVLKRGATVKGQVKAIFTIGKFRILIGTLDYFIATVDGIILFSLIDLELIFILLADLFWGLLWIGYVIVVITNRMKPFE